MTELKFGKYKGCNVEELKDFAYLNYLATNNEKNSHKENFFKINDNIVEAAKKRLDNYKSTKKENGTPLSQLRVVLGEIESQIALTKESLSNVSDGDIIQFYQGMIEAYDISKKILLDNLD